jgi:NADH-quinone oxidoreductase subunit G
MTDTVHTQNQAEEEERDNTVNIVIDGVAIKANEGELLIEAAERNGIFIPRFCYHPHMEPVGMCRMCLVEVSGPRGFALQPACYLKVQENMEVMASSDKAKRAQEGVLELLLINHPLDCPVCDKGGECPLQDQTMSYGPGESRFIEEKRHFDKPIELGPLTYLDRERCIQCARCTRFAAEVAGEPQIDFAGRGDMTMVATSPTRPFDSYFSGNTVQICPVGALTAKAYRFKSRPWDLEQAETTCTLCSVGCREVAQSSAGELVRYLGVDNLTLNQSWLCDKGRYSFEAVKNGRVLTPLARHEGVLEEVRWADALADITAGIRAGLAKGGGDQIAVLGGAKFTNEDNYMWARLAKGVFGSELVDAQLGDGFNAELALALPRAGIEETVNARTVVLIAGDLKEELPVLYLRLYQNLAKGKTKLIEISPTHTSLSDLAKIKLSPRPGELFSITEDIFDVTKNSVGSLKDESVISSIRQFLDVREETSADDGEGIVFVVGNANLAEAPIYLEESLKLIAAKLPKAKFLPALRRGNIFGALDMGLGPNLLPGRINKDRGDFFRRTWGTLPASPGIGTPEILAKCAAGEVSVLVLLGADPLSDFVDQALVQKAFENTPFIISLASHMDPSATSADVVLPVPYMGETAGTVTNLEGRVSVLGQKVTPPALARQPWLIAADIARLLEEDFGLYTLEEVSQEIADTVSLYRGVSLASLKRFGGDGVFVPVKAAKVKIASSTKSIFDPIAVPGIASVEEQGAPIKTGSAKPIALQDGNTKDSSAEALAKGDARLISLADVTSATRHAGGLDVIAEPKSDKYSLRLILQRDLYDAGSTLVNCPTLASLGGVQEILLAPSAASGFGLQNGSPVNVTGRGQMIEAQVKIDKSLSPGLAVLKVNKSKANDIFSADVSDGIASGRAELLVDASALVTDIRLETKHDKKKELG